MKYAIVFVALLLWNSVCIQGNESQINYMFAVMYCLHSSVGIAFSFGSILECVIYDRYCTELIQAVVLANNFCVNNYTCPKIPSNPPYLVGIELQDVNCSLTG
ncbi:hypothetical protein FQR65_LT09342 [Abscondita terminalis]|nr:hypothetical protein FQR65_LT09342 [Abscondita terminalis]